MPNLQRLLVATDYSPAADKALNLACSIANRFGSELHLLHVIDEPLPLGLPEGMWIDPRKILPALIGNGKTVLADHTNKLNLEANIQVIREVVVGNPCEEIQKYAIDRGIGLIVVGTHGHRGISRMLVGSVAERTVRMATCPVMTVHMSAAGSTEVQSSPFHRILVATDFSAAANRARDLGWTLANKFGAELHVLNTVVEPVPLPGPHGTWIRPEDVLPAYTDNAIRALADNVKVLKRDESVPIVAAVKVGFPIEMIQKYIADEQIDLAVLGTQGHRGLSHLLLGSIAEKVVRLANCPVVTTH